MATVRKKARRNDMRTHFEETLTKVKNCLEHPESTEARLIGLNDSLIDQSEKLSVVDEEIVKRLDPGDVEADVLDSMKISEHTYEVFGNPEVLISAHLDVLIKIKRVKNMESVDILRKLYNKVVTCVRNLKSLQVETATYGCLLFPILKEKIPYDLLLIISGKFGVNVWTLDGFLDYLNEKLQAKESCLTLKSSSASGNQHYFLISL